MIKTWVTPGGVHPPENKHQSMTLPIGDLPIPERLLVPLSQHIGAPAVACVKVGETVLKGQKIADATGPVSVPMHAPTSGTISAIEDRPIAHSSGMLAPCIEITSDGKDTWIDHQGIADFEHSSPQMLIKIIADAGIAGMGGAGFPSAIKLNPGHQRPIDTLIINATECEPYITADDSAIRERAAEIIEGIGILSHILGNPNNILIGIEDNKPEAIAALEPHVADTGISVVSFPTKYPSGGEKQLIYILTGNELASGSLPADAGIVCINIGTTYAIKRAVVNGEPLISRVTTMTGNACGINRNYETLIGTPVSHMLAHSNFNEAACSRLVMGGPMMGFSLTSADVPVVKTTNCILAPSYSEIPDDEPAQPCIRCGMCAEACPASLLPQQLFWYSQAQDHDRLEAHNLFDCIECGACSYVCPSNIPLVQHYRHSKGEILKARDEKVKSDHARERFEFHQQRMEQAERDKEAKRAARREAAEKAKANSATSTGAGSAADIIAAAQARATAKQVNPEQQRAKFERSIAGAEMRVTMAIEKLAEAASNQTDEQTNILNAAVESAKQKLEQAQVRLADHLEKHKELDSEQVK
ncbi:MAG: electron transport complex subunit RsxC [Porticoccaceae bacterium]|nr:electron transport complex subunit RsxC [Porticoccaceae bacterium]MDG1308044.1 electron transport complex subunit RsxC [Porticoccaceae bacterium]